MNKLGYLISAEGGEGAGKSTACDVLARELAKRDYKVLYTHEPGSTRFGQHLREDLLNPDLGLLPLTQLYLFMADRAEHVQKVIWPALQSGHIVIVDRYVDSTVAYQGYGHGLSLNFIHQLNSNSISVHTDENAFGTRLLWPDLTFFLDVPVEVGLERAAKKRGASPDYFESQHLEFHKRVREGFWTCARANDHRFVTLDATAPAEAVHLDMLGLTLQRLSQREASSGNLGSSGLTEAISNILLTEGR